jgi:antitoxin (DNA-binding transcriptional repressor) of toxin-antitoxin stability system
MKTVSAGDANRHFSSLLRDVATGETVMVVSRGKPVAISSPARPGDDQREAAKLGLLERLCQQKPTGARNWTRDELYEGWHERLTDEGCPRHHYPGLCRRTR